MDKPNKDENKPWGHINTELKNALDTWTDLTGKAANKVSPEVEQLREIKIILGTLKDKLKEFSDDGNLSTQPNEKEQLKEQSKEQEQAKEQTKDQDQKP